MPTHPEAPTPEPLPPCRFMPMRTCLPSYGPEGCGWRGCAQMDAGRRTPLVQAPLSAAWLNERYHIRTVEGDVPLLTCIRCGEWVGWLTMHAARRHGDPVVVVPPARGESDLTTLVW